MAAVLAPPPMEVPVGPFLLGSDMSECSTEEVFEVAAKQIAQKTLLAAAECCRLGTELSCMLNGLQSRLGREYGACQFNQTQGNGADLWTASAQQLSSIAPRPVAPDKSGSCSATTAGAATSAASTASVLGPPSPEARQLPSRAPPPPPPLGSEICSGGVRTVPTPVKALPPQVAVVKEPMPLRHSSTAMAKLPAKAAPASVASMVGDASDKAPVTSSALCKTLPKWVIESMSDDSPPVREAAIALSRAALKAPQQVPSAQPRPQEALTNGRNHVCFYEPPPKALPTTPVSLQGAVVGPPAKPPPAVPPAKAPPASTQNIAVTSSTPPTKPPNATHGARSSGANLPSKSPPVVLQSTGGACVGLPSKAPPVTSLPSNAPPVASHGTRDIGGRLPMPAAMESAGPPSKPSPLIALSAAVLPPKAPPVLLISSGKTPPPKPPPAGLMASGRSPPPKPPPSSMGATSGNPVSPTQESVAAEAVAAAAASDLVPAAKKVTPMKVPPMTSARPTANSAGSCHLPCKSLPPAKMPPAKPPPAAAVRTPPTKAPPPEVLAAFEAEWRVGGPVAPHLVVDSTSPKDPPPPSVLTAAPAPISV